ncbi:MAG: sugar phosphate isomerase/epimerase [Deferribacteres bacterium]|nr:sugar phosphate isomerase/epimerase [Deferribacteres bacterium]
MPQNDSPETGPHVHVPYDLVDKYLPYIRKERLNLEIYFGSVTFDRLTERDITGLKDRLDYNPALSIHAPFMDLSPGAVDPKVREITKKRFSDVMDFAEILRPRVVVFHSGYDRWKYDNRIDIWLEGSLDTWGPVNKRAVDIGTRIAIENIFEDDPEHLRILMDEMNSGNFGVCFDTGHFNLFSRLTLTEWLGIIKSNIVEVHLHDNSGYADDHLAIGEGNFDFETLFEELEGTGCVYTIEAHNVKDVKKSLKRLRAYID